MHVADFNADGLDDLLMRDRDYGEWVIHLSTGDGFEGHFAGIWDASVDWLDVQVADLTGDGLPDLLARNAANGAWFVARTSMSNIFFPPDEVVVLPTFTTAQWGRWSADVDWEGVQLGDFTGDGRLDVAAMNAASGELFVAENFGGARFETRRAGRFSGDVEWVDWMVGDFGGDRRDDPVARYAGTGARYGAIANTDSSPTVEFENTLLHRWSADVDWADVQAFDINADGQVEILGRNLANGAWWVMESHEGGYRNRRDGRWSGGDGWSSVQAVTDDAGPFYPQPIVQIGPAGPAPVVQMPPSEPVDGSEKDEGHAPLDELFSEGDPLAGVEDDGLPVLL